MLYHSTRSKENTVDSAQAVLNGLAPDGGLYVPEKLPQVDVQIHCCQGLCSYYAEKGGMLVGFEKF